MTTSYSSNIILPLRDGKGEYDTDTTRYKELFITAKPKTINKGLLQAGEKFFDEAFLQGSTVVMLLNLCALIRSRILVPSRHCKSTSSPMPLPF